MIRKRFKRRQKVSKFMDVIIPGLSDFQLFSPTPIKNKRPSQLLCDLRGPFSLQPKTTNQRVSGLLPAPIFVIKYNAKTIIYRARVP